MKKKLMHPNRRVAQPRKGKRSKQERHAARVAMRQAALRKSGIDKARGCC
jgi:hypothetical protein